MVGGDYAGPEANLHQHAKILPVGELKGADPFGPLLSVGYQGGITRQRHKTQPGLGNGPVERAIQASLNLVESRMWQFDDLRRCVGIPCVFQEVGDDTQIKCGRGVGQFRLCGTECPELMHERGRLIGNRPGAEEP